MLREVRVNCFGKSSSDLHSGEGIRFIAENLEFNTLLAELQRAYLKQNKQSYILAVGCLAGLE